MESVNGVAETTFSLAGRLTDWIAGKLTLPDQATAETRIGALVAWALAIAKSASDAVAAWDGSASPALQTLGTVLQSSLSVIRDTFDLADAILKGDAYAGVSSADLTPMAAAGGMSPLQVKVIGLMLVATQIADAVLRAVSQWTATVPPALASLKGVLSDGLGLIRDTFDTVDAVVKGKPSAGLSSSDLSPLGGAGGFSPFQVRVFNLVAVGIQIADAVDHAVSQWGGPTSTALATLKTVLGDALGIVNDTLGAAEKLAKPPELRPLGSGPGSLTQYIHDLVLWAAGLTTAAGEALPAFDQTYPVLEALGKQASNALGVIGTGLEAVGKLAKPPAIPGLDSLVGEGGPTLRTYIARLVVWLRDITVIAGEAVTAFDQTFPALERLGKQASVAVGVIGTGLDAAARLAKPPQLPGLDDLVSAGGPSLRVYIAHLVVWLRDVTVAAAGAISAFDTSTVVLEALGKAAQHAAGVLDTALSLADKLAKPPQALDLGSGPGSVRAKIQALVVMVRDATLAVIEAIDAFDEQTGALERLAGASDKTLGLIEAGLKLPELGRALSTFTGLNIGQLQPKIDLLIANLIELARQFGQQAEAAGIQQAWVDAGEKLSHLMGSGGSAMKAALDLGASLLDPETLIPSIQQLQPKLNAVLALVTNVATQFAAQAASLDADQMTSAAHLGEQIKSVFGGLEQVASTLQKFTGMSLDSSAFNNISQILTAIFALFDMVAGKAAVANQVASALTSILDGLGALSQTKGKTAGESWVGAFIAALTAGAPALTLAAAAALPGGTPSASATTSGPSPASSGGANQTSGGNTYHFTVVQYVTPQIAADPAGTLIQLQNHYAG